MTNNLRKHLTELMERAVDGVAHYDGEQPDLNRHTWIEMAVDKAIAGFMSSLPEPIDIDSKYEHQPKDGIVLGHDKKANEDQLIYLARYADDQGYNRYYTDLINYFRSLYSPADPMVQSEHDPSKIRPQQGEADSPTDKGPSKVR